MEVNVLEHIEADGTFKDSFYEHIPEMAGEEFKDNEIFSKERLPNLQTIFKNFGNTKKAFDAKIEGSIRKPSDDATDEEKAEFNKSIRKMMGVPEKADDYEFPKPDDMPESASYDEEAEKTFRGIFHKHGLTKETVKEIVDAHNQIVRTRIDAHIKAQNEKFDADSNALKNDWKGDSLIKNTRIAYNAMNQFVDDEFKKILRESGIYDNAGDLSKWRQLDVMPRDLRLWNAIGVKMKSPDVSDEGGDKGTKTDTIYKHPSSRAFFDKVKQK